MNLCVIYEVFIPLFYWFECLLHVVASIVRFCISQDFGPVVWVTYSIFLCANPLYHMQYFSASLFLACIPVIIPVWGVFWPFTPHLMCSLWHSLVEYFRQSLCKLPTSFFHVLRVGISQLSINEFLPICLASLLNFQWVYAGFSVLIVHLMWYLRQILFAQPVFHQCL